MKHSPKLIIVVLIVTLLGIGLSMAQTLPTIEIVVTTTDDIEDGNMASVSLLKANPGSDGAISFGKAIQAVNNTELTESAAFNIRFELRGPKLSSLTASHSRFTH